MIDAPMRMLRRNQFLRFLVAGAINTLFGFIVYSPAILAGAAVWLALLLGLVCGTIFNFFSTGGYVFRDLKLARVPRFVIFYFLVYMANYGESEVDRLGITVGRQPHSGASHRDGSHCIVDVRSDGPVRVLASATARFHSAKQIAARTTIARSDSCPGTNGGVRNYWVLRNLVTSEQLSLLPAGSDDDAASLGRFGGMLRLDKAVRAEVRQQATLRMAATSIASWFMPSRCRRRSAQESRICRGK